MPPGVVVNIPIEKFQEQYGTLKKACEFYLDDKMPKEQQAAFERVVPADFISAIADNRLFTALVINR